MDEGRPLMSRRKDSTELAAMRSGGEKGGGGSPPVCLK